MSEIIIYKKIISYFEEMSLKHLAIQFLGEFFLMVSWCATISLFFFCCFFAKVSEKLGDVSTLTKGIQPHLTKLLYHIYLPGKLNSKKSKFSLFLLISRIVFREFAGKIPKSNTGRATTQTVNHTKNILRDFLWR